MAIQHRQPPKQSTWALISEFPPVLTGLIGAFILMLEGSIVGVFLALLLVAIHRYANRLLDSRSVREAEAEEWMRIRVMTTLSCLALPVYLYFTRT